jgi:hypothetical protein
MPSTVISSYNYDPLRAVLRVRFVSGMIYEYRDVPEKIYLDMKKAFSKGTYLNRVVKGTYECARVEEDL